MTDEYIALEEGIVRDTIGAMIFLFVGIGVVILTVILVGIIGAKAHSTTQADVTAITELQIREDVNESIVESFGALADAAGFLPIIILALVFFLVLVLLMQGMGPVAGGRAV